MILPPSLAGLLICLRFFTRLPLPETARERALGANGLTQTLMMVPVAGALTGLCPAVILALARLAGLPATVAAPLAIAALVILTGALHEDGLADCADGFGGGWTRAKKLEIMRDSRTGSYGACALALSLYLRAASLAVIATRDLSLAAGVLVAGAALSRTLCLAPLMLLAPARIDGAGANATGLSRPRYAMALIIALTIASLPWFGGASLPQTLLACAAAMLAALGVCALAQRMIGGQTGDVAGAAQQLSEIAILVVFSG